MQILLMEAAGWKRAAFAASGAADGAGTGALQRNDALAFGTAAGGYLLAVGGQLVVRLFLESLKFAPLRNLEDPCYTFLCAPSAASCAPPLLPAQPLAA